MVLLKDIQLEVTIHIDSIYYDDILPFSLLDP